MGKFFGIVKADFIQIKLKYLSCSCQILVLHLSYKIIKCILSYIVIIKLQLRRDFWKILYFPYTSINIG